jgi:hypothetical protein
MYDGMVDVPNVMILSWAYIPDTRNEWQPWAKSVHQEKVLIDNLKKLNRDDNGNLVSWIEIAITLWCSFVAQAYIPDKRSEGQENQEVCTELASTPAGTTSSSAAPKYQ